MSTPIEIIAKNWEFKPNNKALGDFWCDIEDWPAFKRDGLLEVRLTDFYNL